MTLLAAAKGMVEFGRNPAGSFLQKRIIDIEDAVEETERRQKECKHGNEVGPSYSACGAKFCPDCGEDLRGVIA